MPRTIVAPNHYDIVKLWLKMNAEKQTVRHFRVVVIIARVYISSTEIVRKMNICPKAPNRDIIMTSFIKFISAIVRSNVSSPFVYRTKAYMEQLNMIPKNEL